MTICPSLISDPTWAPGISWGHFIWPITKPVSEGKLLLFCPQRKSKMFQRYVGFWGGGQMAFFFLFFLSAKRLFKDITTPWMINPKPHHDPHFSLLCWFSCWIKFCFLLIFNLSWKDKHICKLLQCKEWIPLSCSSKFSSPSHPCSEHPFQPNYSMVLWFCDHGG